MTVRLDHVGVLGAGMVGLSTAWFLQEQGIRVTVLDQGDVGAGASWGNAGWVTPSMVAPLADPAVLRYGIRAILSPSSPVYVPPAAVPGLIGFLTRFALHSTPWTWRRGMRAMAALAGEAFAAYDVLAAAGVATDAIRTAPVLACGRGPKDLDGVLHELRQAAEHGVAVDYERLTPARAREVAPILGDGVGAALRISGQRYVDPGRFVAALGDAVRRRGGTISERTAVCALEAGSGGAIVRVEGGEELRFDAVAVATGARLPETVRRFGVRVQVRAGRGYSFRVSPEHVPSGPLYFPGQRVAATPLGDSLRLAGMMEFRAPGAPPDERRVRAIVESMRPFLTGVDLDTRADVWVGSRPCTPDGLPVIGATASERIWTAGGHGMWGITLGPATGRLLAGAMTGDRRPVDLAPFDPLR